MGQNCSYNEKLIDRSKMQEVTYMLFFPSFLSFRGSLTNRPCMGSN